MRKLLVLLALTLFSTSMFAAWLNHVSVNLKQPDGTQLNLFATGDEYYNWVHDANGFTVVRNENTGEIVYALLENDDLVPSEYIVGQVNPANLGLSPWLNISNAKMERIRLDALAYTKKMEEQAGVQKSTMDAEGIINNLVVYIRFADQNEFVIDTTLYWDMFNKEEQDYNSMVNYFQMVSYQSLDLTSTFYPEPPANIVLSYEDEHSRDYYMPYNATSNPDGYVGDQRTQREHLLLKNAVDFISDEVPTSLDLDYNNDNNVDNVVFIVKGGSGAWADLLWPHRWSLFNEEAFINGKRVWDFNFQLEHSLNESGVGVLCHEMYHSLGAPDLYHYSQDGESPVGRWDIMESNTNPPQSMGAYMKSIYGGWIDEVPEITESGYYTLNSLEKSNNNVFKIESPNHDWQYFVLEYRKKEGTFEQQIPGTGLLVYRINGAYEGQGNAQGPPDEVYLYRPGGSPTSGGSVANAHFSLETARTEINNVTDPRLFLTNNDYGGIEISEVSSAGETITFLVNMPGEPIADFEADATIICPNQPVTFNNRSQGIPDTYEWTFTPDDITFLNGTNEYSKSPQVSFNTEQNYSVSLDVENDYGVSSISHDNYIQFSSVSLPFFANFENESLSDKSFWIYNPSEESIEWKLMPVEGNYSNLAAGMQIKKNYEVGDRDGLITPPLDFNSYSNMDLQFEYAYAKSKQNFTDSLIIYASADCGETWDRVFADGDNGDGSFATSELTTEEFIPTTTADWCGQGYGGDCININLNEYLGFSKVRLKFETYSQLGNNLYLDNIVIAPNVSIETTDKDLSVMVQPNPANDHVIIKNISSVNQVQLIDMYGNIVFSETNTLGDNEISLSLNHLPNGIYILRLDHKENIKLIKE